MLHEVKRAYLFVFFFQFFIAVKGFTAEDDLRWNYVDRKKTWPVESVAAYVEASGMTQKLHEPGTPSSFDLFPNLSDQRYGRYSWVRGGMTKMQLFLCGHDGKPTPLCIMRMPLDRNMLHLMKEVPLLPSFIFAYPPAIFDEKCVSTDVLNFLSKAFNSYQSRVEKPLSCIFQLQGEYCKGLSNFSEFRLLDLTGDDSAYPEVIELKQPTELFSWVMYTPSVTTPTSKQKRATSESTSPKLE